MCRVVDTVRVDQETVYAPRHGNDRLLLGLKGSLNEYELDLLCQRSLAARYEKARRGIHRVSQLAAFGIGWLASEQPLQLPFTTAAIRVNGGVGEIGPAAADLTSVLEQRLEVGREDRIAEVDGILRITDQTREAKLVLLGVPQPRGQPVQQPHLGLHASEKVCRHAVAAVRSHDRRQAL
jgi:hypothetical protein